MPEPSKLPSIGERIRELRRQGDPPMTQRELAERAGVSEDLIGKLERGVKQTALITTLHKIASALDVDVRALLPGPPRLEAGEQDDATKGGVLAIRQTMMVVRDDPGIEPADLDELKRSARYAWHAFWTDRYDLLGAMLPAFIGTARVTAAHLQTPEAFAVLSDAYGVTGSMLVHLGYLDLAYLAMERAITAADRSGKELRHAAVSGWMSWLLMHQTGTSEQAQQLAVSLADQIEPRLGKATAEHIAVWGGLLLSGGIAAARGDRPDEADDMLNLAETAATRLNAPGREVRFDHDRPFGLPVVIQVMVDACVATGRPGRALEVAKRMPPDAALPLAGRARHLADIAAAQTALGHDREAVATLLSIERTAPNWMRHQPFPRTIIAELLERERRVRTPALRGLARRLNIAVAS